MGIYRNIRIMAMMVAVTLICSASSGADKKNAPTKSKKNNGSLEGTNFGDEAATKILSFGKFVEAPYIGGDGGSEFSIQCSGQDLVSGIKVRAGSYVDAINPLCQSLTATFQKKQLNIPQKFAGGPGGKMFEHKLPKGFTAVGIRGRTCTFADGALCEIQLIGAEIDQSGVNNKLIWLDQEKIFGSPDMTKFLLTIPFGNKTGYFEESYCPDGAVIVGFKGRAGLYLDGIQPVCREVASVIPPSKQKTFELDQSDLKSVEVAVGGSGGEECTVSCNGDPIFASSLSNNGVTVGLTSSNTVDFISQNPNWNPLRAIIPICPDNDGVLDYLKENRCGPKTVDFFSQPSKYHYLPMVGHSIAIGVKVSPNKNKDRVVIMDLIFAPLDLRATGTSYDAMVRHDLPFGGMNKDLKKLLSGYAGESKKFMCPDGYAISSIETSAGADIDSIDSLSCGRILVDGKPGY